MSSPGYLMPASLKIIMEHFNHHCQVEDGVFMDLGCGENRPAIAAFEVCQFFTKFIGVDNHPLAIESARATVDRLIKVSPGAVGLFDIMECSIESLTGLKGATHVYSFCGAAGPVATSAIYRLLATGHAQYAVLVYANDGEYLCILDRKSRLGSQSGHARGPSRLTGSGCG